jgi:hypothetical protein
LSCGSKNPGINKTNQINKTNKTMDFVRFSQGRTGHCGNAAIASRLFFENARLLKMRCILKIFSKKMRLFLINVRDF